MEKKSLMVSFACLAIAIVLFSASAYNLSLVQSQHFQVVVVEKPPITGSILVYVNGEFWCENHNIVVTIGLTRVRDFLAYDNATYTGTNMTDAIGLSTSASSPSAAWTVIPSEITTGGLARTGGTVAVVNSTAYSVTHTFTATATHTDVQLSGLYWSDADNEDNKLFAAAQFTNPATLEADDTLEVTWTVNAQSG